MKNLVLYRMLHFTNTILMLEITRYSSSSYGAAVHDAEKIQRVMRGVNACAIVIPPAFPQAPNKACTVAVDQMKKLQKKQ